MANYNSGVSYNKLPSSGGFMYNSATFNVTFRISDVFAMEDSFQSLIAASIIQESVGAGDAILLASFFNQTDDFAFSLDVLEQFALFRLAEQFGVLDALTAMIVALYASDNVKLLDQITELNTLISSSENVEFTETPSVNALLDLMENAQFTELATIWQVLMSIYERAYMTDADPKMAISDFIIGNPSQVGSETLDPSFDWLTPFNMMYDYSQSSTPTMPEAESDEYQIDGVDGELLEDTEYRSRNFDMVAWSPDGLTTREKEELKRRITEILDATKRKPKKLSFARREIQFDVKYDGQAVVEEGPSFIRARIPFRASAYGKDYIENEVVGSGLILNEGAKDVGLKFTISEGTTNPTADFGGVTVSWSGTVPNGSVLIIDSEAKMVYIEDNLGVRTNAADRFNGNYVTVPSGGSIAAVIGTENEYADYWKTNWWTYRLW